MVKNNKQTPINSAIFSTKFGIMVACARVSGLCFLSFAHEKTLTNIKKLSKQLNSKILPETNEYLTKTQSQLNEYFACKRKSFDIPLDLVGTDFQKSVWQTLLKIPYGETWSYTKEAEVLNKKQAVRAVANANGANNIAIIIPCHRVIANDGSLGGYSGGLHNKNKLLQLERSDNG